MLIPLFIKSKFILISTNLSLKRPPYCRRILFGVIQLITSFHGITNKIILPESAVYFHKGSPRIAEV